MHIGTYVFAQISNFLPRRSFENAVKKYHGGRYAKTLSCRDQLLALMFGQLAYRESLRDIAICLTTH